MSKKSSSRETYGLTSETVSEFVLGHVLQERERQDEKWERQPGDWGAPTGDKFMLLTEDVGEVARAILEEETVERLFAELVQVAAVAVCWAESLLLREGATPGRSAVAEIHAQQRALTNSVASAMRYAGIADAEMGPTLHAMAIAHRHLHKRSKTDEWIEERDGVRVRVKRYQVFR